MMPMMLVMLVVFMMFVVFVMLRLLMMFRLLVLMMFRGLGWLVVMCMPFVVDGARAIGGIVVMGYSGVSGHTTRKHDSKSHNKSYCP